MGISIFGGRISTSCFDEPSQVVVDKNPNPKRCTIIQVQKINDFLLMMVNYPNCTNYEGNKILVFEGVEQDKVVCQKILHGIDPHFSDNKSFISPVARFEPSKRGWNMACQLAQNYKK